MTVRVPRELIEKDPHILAPAAGLRALADDEPGLGRRRRGNGFSYSDDGGEPVTDVQRERIEQLAIPPAWEDVWICADDRGYLQASGVDSVGRRQYRYHDDFRSYCDERKFERLRYFGRAIVLLRKAVVAGLATPVGQREHAIAAAVGLIDRCLLRVGNDQSAVNGHYGATTLTVDHIVDPHDTDGGFVVLEYVAKSGKTRTITIDDDDLADILVELAEDADNELFWFRDEEGSDRRRATASDINAFIAREAGAAFTAKDLRTWGGSSTALAARASGAALLAAVDAAAEELGNTRAVARSSYVHPDVLDADGEFIDLCWSSARSSKWMDRSERALDRLLRSDDST